MPNMQSLSLSGGSPRITWTHNYRALVEIDLQQRGQLWRTPDLYRFVDSCMAAKIVTFLDIMIPKSLTADMTSLLDRDYQS